MIVQIHQKPKLNNETHDSNITLNERNLKNTVRCSLSAWSFTNQPKFEFQRRRTVFYESFQSLPNQGKRGHNKYQNGCIHVSSVFQQTQNVKKPSL